jgi:hypothetical protein
MTTDKDVFTVLSFLIEHTHVGTNDSVRAALARLGECAITDEERAAKRLQGLITKRGWLVSQKNGLADQRRQLDSVAANPGPRATPQQRAHAKAQADRCNAEYHACCKALAETEAAIDAEQHQRRQQAA